MPTLLDLVPGTAVWAWLDPARGREQSGRRPVIVVSSEGYLDVVTTLAVVVPLSTTDRGWPNHVPVEGIDALSTSFALTEQPRTISRERLGDTIGTVAPTTMATIRQWLADFLDL